MVVAELFAKLGISGADKFQAGMKKADSVVKGLSSSSFLAKTAIGVLAAAILKASKVAGQMGLQLDFLQTRTGIAAETFQKLAYAGELAGISTSETQNTLSALQKQMDEFAVSGEGPQWINELAKGVNLDLDRALKDTTYLFQKIQEYATNPAIEKMQKRLVMGSFGISDNMQAAFMKGAYSKKAMSEAPIISEDEIATLTKINTEFSKFSAQIKAATAQVVAAFGKDLIEGISGFMSGLYKALALIVKIAQRSKPLHIILKAIGMAFKGWGYILDGISSVLSDLFDWMDDKLTSIMDVLGLVFNKIGEAINWVFEKIFSAFEQFMPVMKSMLGMMDKLFLGGAGKFLAEKIFGNQESDTANKVLQANAAAAPIMNKSSVMSSADDNRKVTINQTNNFTNADEAPRDIAQATSNAVNDSFRSQTTAAMRGLIGTAGGI